ncbi:MAG: formimidoylglutamate deiminase [Acidimicrobiia bacterium]|jgi:formiminoglutamate deiminase
MATRILNVDHAWLGGVGLAADVSITITDGRIESVEPNSSHPGYALSGIALPGLVSAHSHAFHRALRGRTHGVGGDFWAWREPMYELAGRLDPERYEVLAVAVFGEMLRAGITTVGEFHYLHHQPGGSPYADPNVMGRALLSAASRTGIRITLLDTLYLTADVDGAPLSERQARFSDGTAEAWADRVRALGEATGDRARVGVAAHSVRAVPGEGLEAVIALGEEIGCPVHVHVSEQPAENEACRAATGRSPVEWLADHGVLGARTTLVHATHTSESDRRLIAESGSGVCFCPTTEADLGDGIGPAFEYVNAGVSLSLGTDSNAIIDLFEEARRVEHHDRLRLGRRGLHSPIDLLHSATDQGAKALGWDSGAIRAGTEADLVIIDPDHPDLAGLYPAEAVAAVVMGATRAAVTHVLVGGEMVLSPGGSTLPGGEEIGKVVRMVWS